MDASGYRGGGHLGRQTYIFSSCAPCAGIACWWSAGLVIERLRVRVPARAAGQFSSPQLTFCADSYSVSVPSRVTGVTRKRPRSFCRKFKWQVILKHAYVLDPTKSEWAVYTVQALSWNLSGKRSHKQLVREHLSKVVSARCAIVD